jgi:tetratricopeptide (TPR) repeat protein
MLRQCLLAAMVTLGLTLPGRALAADIRPSLADPRDGWKSDVVLVKDTQADVIAGGILTVQKRAAALEKALAEGRTYYLSPDDSGHIYFVADGSAETRLLSALTMTKDSPFFGKSVIVYDNPYPEAALFLASYYDEVGRTADGLRVLDRGLELDALRDANLAGVNLGQTRSSLLAERGAVLDTVHRSSEALADFDAALAIPNLPDAMHAKLLRGRGYALTDLGRLDDAEKAYRASLSLQPDNPIAISELGYIAHLKSGGATGAPALTSVQPK